MKIIQRLEDIQQPFKNAVITIGNFDGVHIGHQALLHSVIEKAHAVDGTAVAITFEPHPIRMLNSKEHPPLITLFEQKSELIARAGIDVLVCIPFTHEFAAISAHSFVEDLLIRQVGMQIIVVGQDYSFGRNQEGDVTLLHVMAQQLDFQVVVVDWISIAGERQSRISSTRIRELVMAGQMKEATKLLGRYYQIRGQVAYGRNRGGRLLGFPTANINLQDELSPKNGIYAVTVEHNDQIYKAVANIGYSPTFEDYIFTIEVHILDFKGNIYGDPIRVNFIQRLRDEKKFDNVEALASQIRKDIDQTREILEDRR